MIPINYHEMFRHAPHIKIDKFNFAARQKNSEFAENYDLNSIIYDELLEMAYKFFRAQDKIFGTFYSKTFYVLYIDKTVCSLTEKAVNCGLEYSTLYNYRKIFDKAYEVFKTEYEELTDYNL